MQPGRGGELQGNGAAKMSKVGRIDSFDEKAESFDSYVERFELYVQANEVAVGKKLAVFLTVVGPKTTKY